MSWFSDYIGKAESLLNALDSSAGDLLTNSMIESPADDSLTESSTTISDSVLETASKPAVSSLSSSYLNQKSPLPSFSKQARTSNRSGVDGALSGGGGWGGSHRGRSDSSPSSAKPFTTRSGSSASREKAISSGVSPSPSPSATYSLDSSRLSQQLMRGSVVGSDYAFTSTRSPNVPTLPTHALAESAADASKSNPVISSGSLSPPSPSPQEDALLSFLNAPKASIPLPASATVELSALSSSSSPISPSPVSRRSCDMERAASDTPEVANKKSDGDNRDSFPQPSLGETLDEDMLRIDDSSLPRPSTSTKRDSDGVGDAISRRLQIDQSYTLIQDDSLSSFQPTISNLLPSTAPSSIMKTSENVVSVALSLADPSTVPSDDVGFGQTEYFDRIIQFSSTDSTLVGTDVKQLSPCVQVAPQADQHPGSAEKTGSSNGSSESGLSTDGDEADLSDAMKESPTSPFEESEPEMLTSPGGILTRREEASSAEMATSEEGMTSSDIRFPSSGGLTESEPEMIPSPPLEGDRLMTTSQVSSSVSQRFSDCEILSAAELAETEEENSSSPEIKVSYVASSATISSNQGVAKHDPTTEEDEAQVAAVSSTTSSSSSRLELENQLLRSEIHSLNEEMRSAWQRVQMANEERGYAEESAAAAQKRAKECEERIREMSEEFANERDLHAAQADQRLRDIERKLQESSSLYADAEMSLSAKEGQLAVLRVRLEEADAALEDFRRRCANVEEESRLIVADRESTVATHVTALETLKAHSDQLRDELITKTSESDRLRDEVLALETAFAEEKESLGSMVTTLQSQLSAEKLRSLSLQHRVNGSHNSLDGMKKELDEYRAKATRTLQSKDRLIASLQEGSSSSSSPPASLLELEDVKSERNFLRDEVASLHTQLEASRMELADAEAQAAQDREMMEDRLSSSTKELTDLKDKMETLSTDFATSKQELSCAHEQMHRERIQFQEESLKQSEENDDLRRRIETQATSSASSPDLEARLHALAENLISKQTTIESLTTEKTSLKLQLERLSASAVNSNSFSTSTRSATVSIAVDDDRSDFNGAQARMRLPLLFRETPNDTGVTRGVKRAATSLDALGIKIGVFLRRYPIARVFALVYAFILHLWVFIVLLTYTPEMH